MAISTRPFRNSARFNYVADATPTVRAALFGAGGAVAAALYLCTPLRAHAEEQSASDIGLDEIVVTATRRAENQQEVPVAVSALTSDMLAKQGVFETSDLNGAMPNLQVSSPYGQQQPNFSLRGVGVGTEYNANAASPVGVYVDEVYQTFRSSHGQQLFDLEQIEVVRGPQGTLYGRNTTGGAINFITRQPQLEGTNGTVTVGYGNYDRKDVEGAFEFTPIDGTLGVRLAGTYVETDAYWKNKLPEGPSTIAAGGASGLNFNSGRDSGGSESYGVRGIVRFRPSDTIDLSLKGYAAQMKGNQEAPYPTGQSKDNDVIDYTNPNFLLSPVFSQLSAVGLLPASYSRAANGVDDGDVEMDSIGRALTRAKGGVLTAKIGLSDSLRLISISGFDSGDYEQTPTTDCDASPLKMCTIGYDSAFHAFNQDIRLDYSGDRIKLIAGAFYGTDSITADNTPNFFNFLSDVREALGLPASYFNPGFAFNGTGLAVDALPTGITATQHFRQDRKSRAIYAEGSWQFTDRWKLTLGGRYTKDKNEFKEGYSTYFDDTGAARLITVSANPGPYFLAPVGLIPASSGPLPDPLEDSGKSSKFSGRAILDWKITDDVMTYASFSKGYRAGTFNGLAYASAAVVYFVQPEEVETIELGLKSRFLDNRLQVNAAIFGSDYKGQQSQVVDATATANLISLDGEIKGLEVDVQFAATDSLRLSAGFGVLDSEYDDADCPATPITGYPGQIGNCVASAVGDVSVGGNPFPYAAKKSVNLGFDWDIYEVGDGRISLHGDGNYTGQYYYDSFKDYSRGPLANGITGKYTDGGGEYWIFNTRLGYDTERYTVSAWVKNLTDKEYYPFGISIENLFGNGYRVRAAPRTFGLEATVKF